MRIITLNMNGIRAAARKGFFTWLARQRADVVCLQEIRAQYDQLKDDPTYFPKGYDAYYAAAERKGYSGVAIYTRHSPDRVVHGLGWPDFDHEGRYLQIDLPGISVVSLYLPSGTSGDARQAVKYEFMRRFEDVLRGMRRKRREFVICGDWNIAHKNIDIKNWRGNQRHSGFLPEERAWLDWLFGPAGFVDAFRVVDEKPDRYTWWSNRGQAWAKNVGWRIDYQVVTPGLAARVQRAAIYTRERFSDHAPLTMDYGCEL